MKRTFRRATVLAIGLACGCQSDRHFHTVAVYEAPGSGCSIRMEADGVVRSGADLSDESSATLTVGAATTTPGSAGHPRINLQVTLRQGQVHLGSELYVQGTLPSGIREALFSLLSDAGCAPVSEEVEEVWSAMEGVLFGPKGTLMSGQTSVLKVLSTSFGR
jgi:hypothetical protein